MNDAYLQTAIAQLQLARKRGGTFRGECSECRHFRRAWASFENKCASPAVEAVAFNVADAYDKKEIQKCDEQRDTRSVYGPVVCGPDGALFEPRP